MDMNKEIARLREIAMNAPSSIREELLLQVEKTEKILNERRATMMGQRIKSEMKADTNWISVKELLPPMTKQHDEATNTEIVASVPVLVSIDGESVKFGRFEVEGERVYFLNAPVIYDAFGEYEYGLDEISHWMPLPDPAPVTNEQFFKQALQEGLSRRFQREIDAAKA
jgi:hypothetical protein